MPDMMLGMGRSMVTMTQFNEQKQDYLDSAKDLEEGSEEYQKAMEACHKRGASRCVQVANMHRGIYVKAAQFIASLRGGTGDRGIPRAYTDALAIFTDHAPHKSAAEIAEVLKDAMNLGAWPNEVLTKDHTLSFIENEPIASASLAQVHRAILQNGEKVAIKAQYPELAKEVASDFFVFKTMGAQIQQMSAGYDVMWIVEDLEKNLIRELDFRLEAHNAETTKKQLSHLHPQVYIPHIYMELSSNRVLTMELCENMIKANDAAGLAAAGLDLVECAELICSTFAEMIFLHGRVHADPHAGNIYLRVLEDEQGRRPQLVILDHGLYYDLSENDVRINFCHYWEACCKKDRRIMSATGEHFAGALHRFLPLILSPWFIFGGPGIALKELRSAAKGQLPETIGMRDVADFIQATRQGGANLIGLLHSLGYTRGLLEALGYPEERRLACMLKYACLGQSKSPATEPRRLSWLKRGSNCLHLTLLQLQITTLAPFAKLLLKFTSLEEFPMGLTFLSGIGVASSLVLGAALAQRSIWDSRSS